MSVGPVGTGFNLIPVQPVQTTQSSASAKGFADRLEGALSELQASQSRSASSARAWEMGIEQDLAAVMVDQQVASLGFQLALNVRNKALGAYRDIMNMPV